VNPEAYVRIPDSILYTNFERLRCVVEIKSTFSAAKFDEAILKKYSSS
jgi:hypothetical protein